MSISQAHDRRREEEGGSDGERERDNFPITSTAPNRKSACTVELSECASFFFFSLLVVGWDEEGGGDDDVEEEEGM